MKKLVISLALISTCQATLAEVELYECKFSSNPNWVSLEVDAVKNKLAWGGDEIYDIKNNNKDYVTGYGQMGYTDNVGGAVMVFDRINLELHLSSVALLVVDTDSTKKYIDTSHNVAKCKKK